MTRNLISVALQYFKDNTFVFSGRFAARDLKQTVAVGVIKSVEKDQGSKHKGQVCK